MASLITPNEILLKLIPQGTTTGDKGNNSTNDNKSQFPMRAFLAEHLSDCDKKEYGDYDIYSPCPACGHDGDFIAYDGIACCKSNSRPESINEHIDIIEFLTKILDYDFPIAKEYAERASEAYEKSNTFPLLPTEKTQVDQMHRLLEEEYGPPITDAEGAEIKPSFLEKLHEINNRDMPFYSKNEQVMRHMNSRYALLFEKDTIICEDDDTIVLISKRAFLTAFSNVYFSISLDNDKIKSVPLGDFWIKNPLRRNCMGLEFKPEKPPRKSYINLWKGFGIKQEIELIRAYDQCKNFLYHIKEVICGNDEISYKYLMSWLAHMIQKPWEKPGVAIILKSGEGTGKNTFTSILGRIIGDKHYLETSSRDIILNRFNAATEAKILINLSEAIWAGEKRLIGALKTLITDMDRSIERKGIEAHKIECFCRLMMTSNEGWVVPASEDSRRFFVLDVSDKHKQDMAYFETLYKDIDNGVAEAFYTILKHWEITENVRVAPTTDALIEQRLLSMGEPYKFLYEAIHIGTFHDVGLHFIEIDGKILNCDSRDWPEFVNMELLHGSFIGWMKRRNKGHIMDISPFSKIIIEWAGLGERSRPTVNDKRLYVYQMPSHEDCRQRFFEKLGLGQTKTT